MPPAKTAATKKPGPAPSDDFVYTAPKGGTISLPPMSKALNASELRKLRNRPPLEIIFHIMERDNPDDEDGNNPAMDGLDEVLSTMNLEEDVPDFIKQWQEFSKLSLGESSAS